MVTLDQIKKLEDRVNKAVHLIRILKEENDALRTTLESSQVRITELEELITAFKEDQAQIERGILSAIERLDTLEDDLDTPLTQRETEEDAEEASDATSEKVGEPESEQSPVSQEGELGIF